MNKQAIWTVVAAGLLAAAAWGAEVPKTVVYEGILSDPVTGPLAGTQTVEARIFEELTGGVALWEGTLETVVDADGSFQLALSDDVRNPTSRKTLLEALACANTFLELHVEGHGDAIAPRIPFASAPQVMAATYANQSPIGFIVAGNLKVASKLSVKGDVVVGATNGPAATLRTATMTAAGDGTVGGAATVSGALTASRIEMPGAAPVGTIMMWDGGPETIPDGWELFTALNDRIPVGVGSGYALGTSGGEDFVTLTVDQLPEHTHNYEVCTSHNFGGKSIAWQSKGWWKDMGSSKAGSTGNGAAHENRPPYHALYYIIRVR